MKDKEQKPYHLNRETYRNIKGKSKEQLEQWLREYYLECYNDGITETYLAVFRHLFDDFGFTNEQLEELFYSSNNDIDAINQRYISADEICNGLAEEGVGFLKKVRKV